MEVLIGVEVAPSITRATGIKVHIHHLCTTVIQRHTDLKQEERQKSYLGYKAILQKKIPDFS